MGVKTVDFRIGDDSVAVLRNMVGKKFNSYTHDEFVFAPHVYGAIMVTVGGVGYQINCDFEACDYFGDATDAGRFYVFPSSTGSFKSQVFDVGAVTVPVGETISDVIVVNEEEVMNKPNREPFTFRYTKAIAFIYGCRGFAVEMSDAVMVTLNLITSTNVLHELAPVGDDIDEDERDVFTATREYVSLKEW